MRNIEKLIAKNIKDLGYDLENPSVKNVFDSAVDFSEIASKKELIEYIEGQLGLIPNNLLDY